jgi:hypothetical protein
MWREQVPYPKGPAIRLESVSVDDTEKPGNDSLPWREQVENDGRRRIFVLEPASQLISKSSDTRLWREQIRTDSSERELTAARDLRPADRADNP